VPSTLGVVASGFYFSPLNLSPALWLDAADTSTITESSGSVSQWNDKSGNGRNVTQGTGAAQPTTGTRTQNGLNVLDFVRGQWLDAGDILDLGTNAWSSFSVIKFDDTSSSTPFGKHIFDVTDGRYGLLRTGGSLFSVYDNDATATGNVSASDTSTATRCISTVLTRAGASSTHVLRIGGTATTKSFTDVATSWNTNAPWRVGRYGTNNTLDFDGYICEIIFLLRTATAAEIAATENYLTAKWGL
jgi:hypothetical protein